MVDNNEHPYPYPYPYYEERTGKVNCQICGKPFAVISPTHLKTHNMKHSEYKLRFPDAPLSNEEFAVKSLYGRDSDMFKIDTEVKEELPEDDNTNILGDEEIVDKEIIIKSTSKKTKISDPVANMKKRIFNHLSMFLHNVRQNYFIEEKTLGGTLTFRYISDFTDPVLKINVEFPDAFWHNYDVFTDPLRNEKLSAAGWKVINIRGASPSLEKIEKCIQR